MTKAKCHICKFLIVHFWEQIFVIFKLAMVNAKLMQIMKALLVSYKPLSYIIVFYVGIIIF